MRLRSIAVLLVLLSATVAFAATHQAAISWTDSPDKAANPTLSYNVYRAAVACPASGVPAGATKITNVTTASFTDTAVTVGQTYCYFVNATLNGTEASPSNDSGGTVPVAPVTSLTVTVQ